MPPKAKKGGKSKKGGKDAGSPDGFITKKQLDALIEAALVKEEYEKDQEDTRVNLLETDNDALRKVATKLKDRLTKHLAKQARIIYLLKQKIVKQDSRICDLSVAKTKLQQDNRTIEKEHEEKMREMTSAHYIMINEQRDKRDAAVAKLNDLRQFQDEKEDIQLEIDQLEGRLAVKRNQREADAKYFETKRITDKHKLDETKERKNLETKQNLLAMTEDQLHSTTKRTIVENKQMSTELHYQRKEVERLTSKNNRLGKENKLIRKRMSQHASQQNMLATRTRFFQKLIDKLKAQLEEQVRSESREAQNEKVKEKAARKQAQNFKLQLESNERGIRMLEDKVEELSALHRHARSTTETVAAELEASRQAAQNMLELQDDAVGFILMSMDDIKERQEEYENKSPRAKAQASAGVITMTNLGGKEDGSLENIDFQKAKQVFQMPRHLKEMSLEHRSVFLRMLLLKLNSVTSFTPRKARIQQAHTTKTKSRR